MLIIAKHSLGD